MLKNFIVNTSASSSVPVCSVGNGVELSIMSIMINSPNESSWVRLNFFDSNGKIFTANFTIDMGDTIILDNKINLPSGSGFMVDSGVDGICIMVSAAELAV